MAKLPTFEQLGTAPTPQPSAGVVSANLDTSGEETGGRALMQAGGDLQRASNELWAFKEKADTVRVEDAWNQYRDSALNITSGEGGLLNTKGADAVNGDLLGKSNLLLTDARKKIADNLTDDQRRRFYERADVTDMETKRSVLTHLAQQQVDYSKTVFQGSEAAAKSQVAAAPTDPGVFRGAQETLMAQADQYLKQNGVTDKGTQDALKAKLTDSLWVSRINALLYSKPELADAMFRANQDQIKDPELRLVMQNKTREVALGVSATNEANSIIEAVRVEQAPDPSAGQAGLVPVAKAGNSDYPMQVDPHVQLDRDRERLRLLRDEAKADPSDEALKKELASAEASVTKQEKGVAGLRRVSDAPDPLAQNTSGMPNSRDIAAQLPIMMARVTKRADELYGPDQGNPDRAAFIKRLTTEIQSKVSQDVQQMNAVQREAQGTLLDAVLGVRAGGAPAAGLVQTGGQQQQAGPVKVASFSQIQSDPNLLRAWQLADPQVKVAITNMMDRNLREDERGDVTLFRDLFNRIHLEDGDPRKINFYQQIVQPDVANRLSMTQIGQLRSELDRNETPGGRSFNQLRKAADANVSLYFKTNMMFTAQPERQIAATMKWNEDAGRKIDEYVKAGKDVRSLFMLDSKDSIVSPAYLQTYVNSTPAQGLATQASGVRDGQQPPLAAATQPKEIKTRAELDTWFNTLPPNVDRFVGADGVTRMIPKRAAPKPTGQLEQGNIDLNTRPVVKNADGSISTVRSMSVNIDGAEVLIPTVAADGSRILSDKEAIEQYKATGQHLGKFETPSAATAYAEALHGQQEALYASKMSPTGKVQPHPAEEPPVPKLVARESLKDRALRRQQENQVKRADENVRLVEGVVKGAKAVGSAARSIPSAIADVGVAMTTSEPERSARSFRELVKAGSYTPASEAVILDAMDSGLLSPAEDRTARAMLRQLAQQRKK